MNLEIIDHSASKRIQSIKVKEKELEKLIFPFNKHSIQSLEYKPFSRFSLAKSIDDVFDGNLSKTLNKILKDRNTGVAIIEPDIKNSKFVPLNGNNHVILEGDEGWPIFKEELNLSPSL